MVQDQSSYITVFPDFPMGAYMVDSQTFELHLHRNPNQDDHLGIGEYLGEYSPVEHHISVGFSDLSPKKVWNDYLEYKASPMVFFRGAGGVLTEELQDAVETKDKWTYETDYVFENDNQCAYVSSIVTREDGFIGRVLNVCDETVDFEFKNYEIVRELTTIGSEISERNTVPISGELEFSINSNSGKNIVQYPKSSKQGMIKPYNLNTYLLQKKNR